MLKQINVNVKKDILEKTVLLKNVRKTAITTEFAKTGCVTAPQSFQEISVNFLNAQKTATVMDFA